MGVCLFIMFVHLALVFGILVLRSGRLVRCRAQLVLRRHKYRDDELRMLFDNWIYGPYAFEICKNRQNREDNDFSRFYFPLSGSKYRWGDASSDFGFLFDLSERLPVWDCLCLIELILSQTNAVRVGITTCNKVIKLLLSLMRVAYRWL